MPNEYSSSTSLTRRSWLRLCAASGAAGWLGEMAFGQQKLEAAVVAVDHLLLGAPDLDEGIAWVERLTGVKARMGGSHPGVGTRNALLSLGGKRYLEILAPDPAQSAYNFPIDVRKFREPQLITWAAGASDVAAIAKTAAAVGHQIFGPRAGSRQQPDGKVLKWKTVGVLSRFGVGTVDPMPFFIEWDPGSVHPSQDSPQGCELRSFEMEHPDAEGLTNALKNLGINATVKPSKTARLRAILSTPKGSVELS